MQGIRFNDQSSRSVGGANFVNILNIKNVNNKNYRYVQYGYHALFEFIIWTNDNPITGNFLNVSNIIEPRKIFRFGKGSQTTAQGLVTIQVNILSMYKHINV